MEKLHIFHKESTVHTNRKLSFIFMTLFMSLALACPVQAYEALTGPTGVLKYDKTKAYAGYTLFSPQIQSKKTYLIDMEGNIVHEWACKAVPGLYAELLPNGHLLRAERIDQAKQLKDAGLYEKWGQDKYVRIGGTGGILREYDWDGNVVWEYIMATPFKEMQHHTFKRMPNGNTLILGWEFMSKEDAIKHGRDPKKIPDHMPKYEGIGHNGFWNDFVREVDPQGKTVWEWHVSDHLGKGDKKFDFNYQLPAPVGDIYHYYDWSHFNTVDYIPESDTIVLNSRNLAEFYLVNHKTGELEYRWGNPSAYDPEAKKPGWYDDGDQELYGSHCATPLENGHILVFDNGSERPEARRSRAVEVDPATGKIVWEYESKHTQGFFSNRQGGVQRLANGNTLICSTHGGHVFEVTPDHEVVWEFISPFAAGKTYCVLGEEQAMPGHIDSMFNMIHRAFRYAPDYPGLKGRDLSPKSYVCGDDCPRFFRDFAKVAK